MVSRLAFLLVFAVISAASSAAVAGATAAVGWSNRPIHGPVPRDRSGPSRPRAIHQSCGGVHAPAGSARQQGHVRGGAQLRALLGQFRDFQDSYDDMNFTSPYLSTITTRTLIVHGDRDPFFPVSIPVGMYEAIPDAHLWIVPNAGHDLLAQSAPWTSSLQTTVADFLANWGERPDG